MSAIVSPSLPDAFPTPAPARVVTPVPVSPAAPLTPQPPPQPFRWTLAQYRELDKIGFFDQ